MKLIVGLGNPGAKYTNTRHNTGYLFVDLFNSSPERPGNIKAVKTGIMMNDSGRAVKKLANAYHLMPSALCIVHDDLDIPLGKYKIQFGRGPKDHNGIKSVNEVLGTEDYWRIRIGIENRKESSVSGEEYTLWDFTPGEREIISGVIKEIIGKLK